MSARGVYPSPQNLRTATQVRGRMKLVHVCGACLLPVLAACTLISPHRSVASVTDARAIDSPAAAEAKAFLAAHPDLYENAGGKVRLSIHDGDLLTGSLTAPGFATSVHPDWSTLQPLARPTTKTLQEQVL